MKLKTSFFNTTVLKKDITRFAPLWGLYSVFMLLVVLLIWDGAGSPGWFAADAPDILQLMGIVNFVYAGLCAALLFGDLFKPQMCNALHAMPLRREGWFLTHATAGMLFCLIPNTVGALLAALMLQQYCYLAFLWLAVMILQFLFFFSVGVFGTVCAGNRLGAVAIYAMINFFAVFATWLTVTFYEPLLYGIRLETEVLFSCSPVVGFSRCTYVDVRYYSQNARVDFRGYLPEQWQYLLVAVGVGLVLLGLSVLIYRKRQMERAGDLIAFRPAKPVFLVIYTLCAGALMYFVAEMVSGSMEYLFLLIGLFVGYFTGKMLLEKKIRVFRGKAFVGFGVLVAAFALSTVVVLLDPLGITRYVPRPEQVSSVMVSPYAYRHYLHDTGCLLTDPADIEQILQIHDELVKTRPASDDMSLNLYYRMKNGTTVERFYYLDAQSDLGQQLKKYYSSEERVFGTADTQKLLESTYLIEVYSYEEGIPAGTIGTGEMMIEEDFGGKWGVETDTFSYRAQGSLYQDLRATGLIQAIQKDCAAGNMAQQSAYHRYDELAASVFIHYITPDGSYTKDIAVYSDCDNTVAYLKSLTEE